MEMDKSIEIATSNLFPYYFHTMEEVWFFQCNGINIVPQTTSQTACFYKSFNRYMDLVLIFTRILRIKTRHVYNFNNNNNSLFIFSKKEDNS
jgi:hypothetical protein